MPATATGRGAQVVIDPLSDTAKAIRGAYATTFQANAAKVATDVSAGLVSDGNRPDGTTSIAGKATDVAVTPLANLTATDAPFLPLSGGILTGALQINIGGGATAVTASGPHLLLTAAAGGLVLLGSNTMATAGFAIGGGSGTQTLAINGAAGAGSGALFQTGGTTRWGLGGDASDNLQVYAYSAVGAFLGSMMNFGQGPLRTYFNQSAQFASTVGFNNTAPIAKPTVTGSKGANAALASLLTALASYGLVTDSST